MSKKFSEKTLRRFKNMGIVEAILGPLMAILFLKLPVPDSDTLFFLAGELCGLSGLLAFLAGLALFTGLVTYLQQLRQEEGCTVPVKAVLTSVRESQRGAGKDALTVYIPTYTYNLNGFDMQVETSSYNIRRDHYVIGTEVDMLVAPGQPKRYKLVSESATVESLCNVCLAIGLPLSGISILMWIIMVPMTILAYLL